jgi:DNA-binding winged helix-turn-helix (wHTH) protein
MNQPPENETTYGLAVASGEDQFATDITTSVKASTDGRRLEIPLAELLEAVSATEHTPAAMLHIFMINGDSSSFPQLGLLTESSGEPQNIVFAGGECILTAPDNQLLIQGQEVMLTSRESSILRIIAEGQSKTVLAGVIISQIWPDTPYSTTNSQGARSPLGINIARIRKQVDEIFPGAGDPKDGIIRSVRRKGYRTIDYWPLISSDE